MAVHVDTLFQRMNDWQAAVQKAMREGRWSAIAEERRKFQQWCEEVGLPIDFTNPNEEG